MAVDERTLTAGLDALEVPVAPRVSRARRVWQSAWPKLLAIAIAWAIWQFLYWIEWKPHYALPSPDQAVQSIFDHWDVISTAIRNTLSRAVYGYALALVIGTTIGALVARNKVLRAGIGSMITGLQTMPSVAWFPAAVLLFGLNDSAIIFVVVMGAAPSIANGLINGIDNISPVLLRAGRILGARRFTAFRTVILPASLPSFIGGLKQGWAFAWRSLLAGELIVLIPGKFSLGQQLDTARQFADAPGLYGMMIVIFVIGVLVDTFVFGFAERKIRKRYGLVDTAAA
ncbi:MAG TPA: ABC transporter permease [Acidimicrobiia bacterium]|jgi:NitT/TauT family transport system permease protein|nr:ABC transporter permease [Acidimicrobiia bacterium]